MRTKRSPIPTKQPAIGNLIRSLREQLGLTQEKFAAQLGVTFPTVNRWENKRATPSPLALDKIESMLKQLESQGQELLMGELSEQE